MAPTFPEVFLIMVGGFFIVALFPCYVILRLLSLMNKRGYSWQKTDGILGLLIGIPFGLFLSTSINPYDVSLLPVMVWIAVWFILPSMTLIGLSVLMPSKILQSKKDLVIHICRIGLLIMVICLFIILIS